jgi:hypothetical protein
VIDWQYLSEVAQLTLTALGGVALITVVVFFFGGTNT